MKLKKLTVEFGDSLIDNMKTNDANGYYGGVKDFNSLTEASEGIIGFGRDIDISNLSKLDILPSEKPGTKGIVLADKRNCKIIWNTLGNLSISEASDPMVWSYLSHFVCREYIVKRHPYNRLFSRENWLFEKFNSDTANLLRYEGSLSKLWWTGYILKINNSYSFDDALDLFYISTDMHNVVFGSPILISFNDIFSGVLRLFDRKIKSLGGTSEFLAEKSNTLEKKYRIKIKSDPTYKPLKSHYILKYRRFFTVLNASVNGYNIHLKNNNQLDAFLDDIYDNKI